MHTWTIGSSPIISTVKIYYYLTIMRLYLYYKYIYNFDVLYKHTTINQSKNIKIILKKKTLTKTYLEYILLELALNQKFCLLKSIITLRNQSYWIFLDNYLCSLILDFKNNEGFYTYIQNIVLTKNIFSNKEVIRTLIKNISIIK